MSARTDTARRRPPGEGLPAGLVLPSAYALGTWAAAIVGGGWWLSAAAAGIAVLAVRGAVAPRHLAVVLAAVVLAGAGHARFLAAAERPPPLLASLTGVHEVTAVLREDATLNGLSARADLDVETIDGAPAGGGLRMTVRAPRRPLLAGERIRARAEIEPPPAIETFDYAGYLRSRGIYAVAAFPKEWERLGRRPATFADRLRTLRRAGTANIERSLPEPAAALAAGVLLGERRTMPSELSDALRVTGTTHLVVVSGQNVALLLGSAVALLTFVLARRTAAIVALALLPPYVLLVGADPPVVRAAVMAVGIAAGAVTGRRTPGWFYLINAAGVMLALNPLLALDIAFQLSMSATAGVMLVARPLRDAAVATVARWRAGRALAPVLELAATATAATLTVVPVQAAAFEQLSLISIPANVIVAPLYEATVLVAFVTALLGGLDPVPEVAWTAGRLAPNAFLDIVAWLAPMPGAVIPVRAPLIAGALFYAGLVGFVALLRRVEPTARAVDGGESVDVGRTLLFGGLAVGLWAAVLVPGDGAATVTVLDVGQGLSVLVRDGGRAVLIDTGPPDGLVLRALPRAGAGRRLDAIVITHADADHAGGAPALTRRLTVGGVFATERALPALAEAGVTAHAIDIGDRLHLGPRTTLEVLSPPVAVAADAHRSSNDGGLVLLITVGERRILVAADIEAPAERWLVASGVSLHADALVVPHHGSRTSSTPEFLDAVDPAVAVISVGSRNSFGHPSPEVLERYTQSGVAVYRTDLAGDVTLRTDGERMWVVAGRE
ncbi:MAG: DNA internalization-related competence protein ComEC/Rec2 [Dehalococcoidia bacterium]